MRERPEPRPHSDAPPPQGRGAIALVGSGEFLPTMEPTDRELLSLAGGPATPVAVLPTAAGPEGLARWAELGVAHFRRLGAEATAVMAGDRATANDPAVVAPLRHAHLIYLSGGDPRFLLETLRDSLAWRLIQRAQGSGGAVLVGCSAGAMVLGALVLCGGRDLLRGAHHLGPGAGPAGRTGHPAPLRRHPAAPAPGAPPQSASGGHHPGDRRAHRLRAAPAALARAGPGLGDSGGRGEEPHLQGG